jgi:glycosyltransferase involved in cell wall biosynthesis
MVLGTIAAVNVRYKGQEYVIKAIYELNKNGYNFEYHLVGDGDNSFLKAVADRYNIADKVKFLGGLPHSKIFDYLDSIDIYVQPSKTEGLPRALVEAMSRACPSLGSASGGIPELLNKEFIFKDGDTKDICEIIKKLVYRKLLLDEAVRSFEKSKEFEKHLLNERRNVFYAEFIKNSSIKF